MSAVAAHLLNIYSRRNLGDAALVEGAVAVVRESWPGARLTAATRFTEDHEWLRSLDVTPVEPISDLPAPGSGSDVVRMARFARSVVGIRGRRRSGPPANGDARWSALSSSTVALSAGGGYLFSRGWRRATFEHILLELEVSARTVPTILLPQSIGPLTTRSDRRRVAAVLSRVHRVLVRDRESEIVARDVLGLPAARVMRSPDLAFALARPPRDRPSGHVPCVAVTVLDWRWAGGSRREYARYLDAVARIVDELVARGVHVELLVQVDLAGHARQDDRAEAERVRARLARADEVPIESAGSDPTEAITRYGEFDAVVGSRLHSALLALCAGTPSVALGYQPKAGGAYEELGLSDWVFPARGLEAGPVLDCVTSILDDRASAGRRVAEGVASAQARLSAVVSSALDRGA